jgi:parvulin-like peptidyl-prolyl isomerase
MPQKLHKEKHPGRYSRRGRNACARIERTLAQKATVHALVATLALSVIGVAACGTAAEGPAVAHVGPSAIAKSTVEHWARVIERGGGQQAPGSQRQGTPQQRALSSLISAEWISGEAARQGVAPSDGEVSRAVTERREANGAAEFQSALHATGQTLDDVRLEVKTELAAAAIGRKLAKQATQITDAEIASFYARHRPLFVKPEERDVDLIEHLPSPAAAIALVRRIGTGARFARRALREPLLRDRGANVNQTEKDVTNAIFVSRPGVVSRPMVLNNGWTVFIVRKITPAKLKPLASVRGEVIRRLIDLRHREITASFEREYEARWRSRTRCGLGYAIQKCARYTGARAAEESPFPSE